MLTLIYDIIENIKKHIFQYDIPEIKGEFTILVEELNKIFSFFNQNQVSEGGQILNYLNIGMQNQDYLLVVDLLQYELLPFLTEECSRYGGN